MHKPFKVEFILILIVVAFTAPMVAANTTLTNLERLQALYRETIDLVFTNIDLNGKRVQVHGSAPDSLQARLFEDQTLEFLSAQNGAMTTDTTKNYDYNFKYILIGQNIDYEKIKRRQFQRTVSVETHCQLQDQDQVVFSNIIQVSETDTIKTSNLKILEDSNYEFTTGTEKPGILEPVLVSALTGAVIYIFYSYRSQ